MTKNLSLTVTQYETLINYLNTKKQEQLKFEIGESVQILSKQTEKSSQVSQIKHEEKNLQDKIYQILSNKIPQTEVMTSSLNEIEKGKLLEKIRSDERVRNTMKSLMRKIK